MPNIFQNYLTMDPFILLSAVNLKLRDSCSSLEDLCKTHEIDEDKLVTRLKEAGFTYNAAQNQFR
ncbi:MULTISPECIES: DUF4250 domain-containing protein [unclassified Anaerobiospirillum]|uniref:DUF4250 domain-containing protein n=1 Tax=unclassified Anaerobiospirillum TaxID=2647410 RepID=UPI001FF1C537|nr:MULTISPECIES: DUF4250 domain-containing protein [unclassified Anaerobiospirillum]MCK0525592.1 DUF4250 domain-containing protein [Anaerobiospirillum sp. NML120449]MCK0533676.1 DUF4250 domain-containing protein [Anaerobiospirillum sp. NML120511]MCK0539639.1 DUF4250 domain-containing protein [Anaerobiospirillum sp. NML02-A-032]